MCIVVPYWFDTWHVLHPTIEHLNTSFGGVWSTTKSISVPKSLLGEMLLFFGEKRAEGTPPTVWNDDVSQNE